MKYQVLPASCCGPLFSAQMASSVLHVDIDDLGLEAGKFDRDLARLVRSGRLLYAFLGQLHGPSVGIGRLAFEYRGNRCDRDHLGNS